MYNELNVTMSYCLETSTMSTFKDEVLEGFSIDKYRIVGEDFVICLNKWNNKENFFVILKKIRAEVEEKKKKKSTRKKEKIFETNENNVKLLKLKKKKQLTLSEAINKEVIYFTFGSDQEIEFNKVTTCRKGKGRKRAESEQKKNIIFNHFLMDNKNI